MAKEELRLQLIKWHNKMSAKFGFDMEDTSEFSELMKQLDEPKKVVIPEFIANDIKYHKKHGYTLLGALGSTFDQRLESDVYCWFFADDGSVKKYINAWNNGYEVEKEKKYRVKIDSKLYFQRFENIEAVFVIDDSLGVKESSPVFTREVGNKILEILGVESGQLEEAEDY